MNKVFQCFESTFTGSQGKVLFYQTWQPRETSKVKGTVLITHGLSGHSDCYTRFAQEMTQSKWNVVCWDLPGHGRSEGKRGYIEDFNSYCQNLAYFTQLVEKEFPTAPLVVFGHSMGGLITLQALILKKLPQAVAVCLSSPALELLIKPSRLKKQIASLTHKYLPQITFHNEIDLNKVVRSLLVQKEYIRDPLRHGRISPEIYFGMKKTIKEVNKNAHKITIPALFQLAGEDYITSTVAAQNFYKKLGSTQKTLYIYKDSYHEVFNDLDKSHVFKDFKQFLSQI